MTQVRQKPEPIWSSSRNEPSDWSISPAVTLPAHVEHAPARHEYGRSMPASCATREETNTRENRQSMCPRARVHGMRVHRKDSRDDGWISIAIAIDPARDSNAFRARLGDGPPNP